MHLYNLFVNRSLGDLCQPLFQLARPIAVGERAARTNAPTIVIFAAERACFIVSRICTPLVIAAAGNRWMIRINSVGFRRGPRSRFNR
jgi:hypothetical protein